MSAESPVREDNEPINHAEESEQDKHQVGDDPRLDNEERRGPSRSPSRSASPTNTNQSPPSRSTSAEARQLSTSNDDSSQKGYEHKSFDRNRSDTNGTTYNSRRNYERQTNYPRNDSRPYGRGGYRGGRDGNINRGEYYESRGPIISDHRNFGARREYNNYPPGGRGYPSTKRDFGSMRPDDAYGDQASKRMRRSPERGDFRFDAGRGGYDQRRPPYQRRSTPPLGPPPQRGYDTYGRYPQPPPARYDGPGRQYDDRKPFSDAPPYQQSRSRTPPPMYERGGYDRGRGTYNGARYPERRPMINEERAVAAGFDSYNRGPAYSARGPPSSEDRYHQQREAPVVIDRRNPDRYNQQSYNTSYDNRRRGSFEDTRRSGTYYSETSTNQPAYTEHQRDASYTSRSGGYSNSYPSEYNSETATYSSGGHYGARDYTEQKSSTTTVAPTSQTSLPPNWVEYTTKDGKKYYYHQIEKKSQWEVPTESGK
jgi:hypothetical protein